jgi:hypothetical protein
MPIHNEAELEEALLLLATKLDAITDRLPGPHTEQSGIPQHATEDALKALFAKNDAPPSEALAVQGEFDEADGASITPPPDPSAEHDPFPKDKG